LESCSRKEEEEEIRERSSGGNLCWGVVGVKLRAITAPPTRAFPERGAQDYDAEGRRRIHEKYGEEKPGNNDMPFFEPKKQRRSK